MALPISVELALGHSSVHTRAAKHPAAELVRRRTALDQIGRMQLGDPPKGDGDGHQAHHEPDDVQVPQAQQQAREQQHDARAEQVFEPAPRRNAIVEAAHVPGGKRRLRQRKLGEQQQRCQAKGICCHEHRHLTARKETRRNAKKERNN